VLTSDIVKVLFFSPFSNIWAHSFPEALIAEGLVKQGVDVSVIRCGGMLDLHCVAMSASGVGPRDSMATKKQVCRACIKRRDLLGSTMPFPTEVMDDHVEASDRAAAAAAVAAATTSTWSELMVDDVPLGRYAAYEFLLNHKLVGTHIPDDLFDLYLDQLRMTVTVYFASKRMIAAHRPDHVVVFNRLYSANHAFCAAAEKAGIPTYTLQGGGHVSRRAETMTMYRDAKSLADVFQTAAWQDYRTRPIGAAEVALVGEHFSGLLEGSSAFAYSSAFEASDPAELRKKFGVPEGAPVLLVPMSSEDEINAARLADALPQSSGQVSVFPGQLEWISFLLGYARERPDRHLIIRLHPRMFPNKRENVLSPIVEQLMALLEARPANVSLNLPSDEVSLYDLMQIVDVVLSFRSSVGAELAAFGIPVVVPANADFFTYPEEINLVGADEADYADKIDSAIAAGWSLENTRRSFRWFSFLFTRIAVDFSDSVQERPITIRPKKPGFRLWLWRKAVYVFIQFGPLIRERLALRNRAFAVSSQQLFLDVFENDRNNLAESALWPPVISAPTEETALLAGYLDGLASTLWEKIDTPDSLTGKIRAFSASR
jgi:hypothetical protein